MKKFLLFTFVILLIGCSHIQNYDKDIYMDERLIGSWKSDKDKTIEWLKENRRFSDEKLKRFGSILGKLNLTITETKIISEYNGSIEEQPLNIIAIGGDTIAVVYKNPLTKCSEIRILRIEDENTHSIYLDMFDIREFFTRIK